MRKGILGLMLTLALCFCLQPMTVSAASHDHTDTATWTEWTGNTTLKAGNYYLSGDVNVTNSMIPVRGEVTLCLNGKTLNMGSNKILVGDSETATLTICDCGSSAGTITGASNYEIIKVNGGNRNLVVKDGVTIKNTAALSSSSYAILNDSGTVEIVDASISVGGRMSNIIKSEGGIVKVKGGVISGYDNVINLSEGAKAHITGGEIKSEGSYAFYVNDEGVQLYLSGTPSISGSSGEIYLYNGGSISAMDEGKAESYGGSALKVRVSPVASFENKVIVQNGVAVKDKFSITNTDYELAPGTGDNAAHLMLQKLHTHSWAFAKDGETTIKATCTNDCPVGVQTLKLDASTCAGEYNGSPRAKAKVETSDSWGEATSNPINRLYKGTGYEELNQPPTNVGVYTVSVTFEGVTIEDTFEITKATQAAAVSHAGFEYGSTGVSDPTLSGAKDSPDVTYYYNTTNSNSDGTKWEDMSKLKAGSYYVYAELAATQNYNAYTTDVCDFEVTKRNVNVTPNAGQNKTFGTAADPTFNYSVTLVNGDTLTGELGREAGENARTYAYTLGTLANENYNLTLAGNVTFEIKPKTLTLAMITLDKTNHEYTGSGITPVVTVKDVDVLLTEDTDYTLTGNVTASAIGPYKLIVNGQNNYTGSVEVDWAVVQKEYTIISGAEQTVSKNKEAVFVSDADAEKFVEVKVDGNVVGSENYRLDAGSTKVTLNKEYVNSLTVGNHTLDIVSNDGVASTTFTVKKASTTHSKPSSSHQTNDTTTLGGSNVPNTGDETNFAVPVALMIAALAGMAVVIMKRKKCEE